MASRVKGHRELSRNLRQLARFVERPIAEAQRASLKPILATSRKNLKANGSYLTGETSRSMAIRTPRTRAKGIKRALIGATGKGRGKAHLIEFGTDPHWQPKRKVLHPGAKAAPFLTPAYETHRHDAMEIFGKRIGEAMERQAARLGKKR